MSEHDQRQYRLMLDALNEFESDQLKIDTLISNFEGLLRAVEATDDAWKRTALEYWADLEQARAIALFHGRTKLDEQEAKVVHDAVSHLKLLVLDRIDDPADRPQDINLPRN
jgi:hypothetical protein